MLDNIEKNTEDQTDPFAKYGGKKVVKNEDPFAKYGGAILKKKESSQPTSQQKQQVSKSQQKQQPTSSATGQQQNQQASATSNGQPPKKEGYDIEKSLWTNTLVPDYVLGELGIKEDSPVRKTYDYLNAQAGNATLSVLGFVDNVINSAKNSLKGEGFFDEDLPDTKTPVTDAVKRKMPSKNTAVSDLRLPKDFSTKAQNDGGPLDPRPILSTIAGISSKIINSTLSQEQKNSAIASLNVASSNVKNGMNTIEEYKKGNVSEGVLNNVIGGIIGFVPDIAVAAMMKSPQAAEGKLVAMSKKATENAIPLVSKYAPKAAAFLERSIAAPMTKIFAAKGAVEGMANANVDEGENMYVEGINGAAKGALEGIYMHGLGEIAGKVSPIIAKGITKTKINNAIASELAMPLANAGVFVTARTLRTGIEEQRLITAEEAATEAGIGIGFSLLHAGSQYKNHKELDHYYDNVIKDDPLNSYSRILNETKENLQLAYDPNLTEADVKELNIARKELKDAAIKEVDLNVKKTLGDEALKIQNKLDAHYSIKKIVENKDALIDNINNNDALNIDQKEYFTKKISSIADTFDMSEMAVKKREFDSKMEAAQSELDKANQEFNSAVKPSEKIAAKVKVDNARKTLEDLNTELTTFIKEAPVAKPVESKAETKPTEPKPTETTDNTERTIEDIEADREKELSKYNERDNRSLERITPNNPNHEILKVGQKWDTGYNAHVQKFYDETTTDGEGVKVITKVIEAGEYDSNGKLKKAPVVEVTIFDSKEQADKYIEDKYNKVKEKADKKEAQNKVNTKYDQEIADLKAKAETKPTETNQPVVTAETSSNFANMTQDGEGNFVFYHVSPNTLEEIDPTKYGSNAGNVTSRDEKSAIGRVGGVSMFYTDPKDSEHMVNGNKHMVKVPEAEVYDFNSDPKNFIDEAEKQFKESHPDLPFTPNDQFAWITKVAGDNGYKMVVGEWGNGKTRAQTTQKLTPVDVMELNGNVVTKPFEKTYVGNREKGFKSVVPESKDNKIKEANNAIRTVRSREGRYDELYQAVSGFRPNTTNEEINKLVNESDIPQELKDQHNEAMAYEPGKRRAEAPKGDVGRRIEEIKADPENEFGETFDPNGNIYDVKDKDDIVTLASENVKADELNEDRIDQFKEKHKDIIDNVKDAKVGVFRLANGDYSIDLNTVVDSKYRENTLKFARDNNQESIYNGKEGEIKTGGNGETILKDKQDIIDAANKIANGESYEIKPKESETDVDLEALHKLFDESEQGGKFSDEQVENGKKAIEGIVPDVEWVIHDTNESMKSATGTTNKGEYILTRDKDGNVKREIHINKVKADGTTVAHEVFHAVLLEKVLNDADAQDLTKRMMKAVAKTASPKIKQELEDFVKTYPEYLKDEERLAQLVGILAKNYDQLSKPNKTIIKKWLDKLAKMFGLKPFTDNEVIDLLNTIAGKTARGEAITKKDVKILGEDTSSWKRKRSQAEDLFLDDKKPKLSSTKDVANFLDKWANENKVFDKDIKDIPDEDVVKEFVNHVSSELKAWSKIQGDKYVSFYDDDINKKANPTLQKYAKENYGRELNDEEVKLFHLVSAFASPSANPYMDSWKGFYIFNRYMNTGELSGYSDKMATIWETLANKKRVDTGVPKLDSKGNPIRSKVTPAYSQTGIEKFQTILDKNNGNLKKAMDWMTSKHSFKDISDMFGYPLTGPKAMKENEYLSKKDGGTGVFGMTGAKLGSYILNRFGDFSTVTKDMWYARTMARLSGEKLIGVDKETNKESAIKTPWAESTKEGKRKRELADKAFKIVADDLGTSPAMVQERIWDFEKRLYEMLGANEDAAYVSDGLNKGIEIANEEAKVTKRSQKDGEKLIDDYVRISRNNNFSDATIKRFLKSKGFSDADIDAALAPKEKSKNFVKSFFSEDVVPRFKSTAEAVYETSKAVVNALSPKTGVNKGVVTKFYELTGDRNKSNTFVDKIVGEYEKTFDKMTTVDRVEFVDRMKAGKAQATPELDVIAKVISRLDKDLYDEITKYSPNLAWKENHFRVLWKKVPGKDKEKFWSFLSKRPLRGTQGFFKQSTLSSMTEGIAKGGEPHSTNPITMFKLAYDDSMKFITSQRIITALKKDGVIKFVKSGEDVPEGFTKINDNVANVYFKSDSGMVKTGEYYIQEGPGRMLNNMLSRDMIRDTKAGKSLMDIKNLYTQVELSLSPFHAVAITLEQIASGAGIGFRKIVNLGDVKGGIKDILTAPFSPKNTFSLGRKFLKFSTVKDFENSKEGKELLRRMPEAAQYVDDFFKGGGLMKQHEDLKANTYKALKENMGKNNYIGATLRALPAINEGIMDPLFNVYIPSLKIGLFMKEFPLILAENKSRLEKGTTTREKLSRDVIDSIDNRLGEMNFDNLYWNKTFKTSMQFMLRSVTWKLGNIRQMGGAAPEQAIEFYNAIKEKRRPNLSPKMAWLFGLSLTQVVLSSIIQGMSLDDDDKNKDIKDFKDIVAPRINSADDKERVVIPTYYKDLLHFWHAPTEYVSSGVSGPFGKGLELYKNKDFYGYEIYDETDPKYKQLFDAAKHSAPEPFSISSYKKMRDKGEPVSKQALSFLGFNKAPGYLEHSDLESEIIDLYRIRNTSVKPLKMKEANDKKKEIRDMYKKDIEKAQEMADEAVNSGLLRPTQVSRLFRDVAKNEDAIVYFFQRLPETDKEYIYSKMTKEEKAKFDPKNKLGESTEENVEGVYE